MKKNVFVLIIMGCLTVLLAKSLTNTDIDTIVTYSKEGDTSTKKIQPYSFMFENKEYTVSVKKLPTYMYYVSGRYLASQPFKIDLSKNSKNEKLIYDDDIPVTGQHVDIVTCKRANKSVILAIMLQSNKDYVDSSGGGYSPYLFEVSAPGVKELKKERDEYFVNAYNISIVYFKKDGTIDYQNPNNEIYPYYNKETIENRLYEVGICQPLKYPLAIIESTLKDKNNTQTYNSDYFNGVLNETRINKSSLESYNNIAYYLQQAGANQESAYLLEKIIEKFPDRTVAYFNLGDAYYGLGDKTKAIKAYQTYIDQMKKKGLDKKIPKRVLERVGINN